MLNIAHPWQTPKVMLPHFWRFLIYQPFVATIGVPLQRRTPYLEKGDLPARPARLDPQTSRVYTERFRDPVVARTGRDTYRTFLPRRSRRACVTARHRRSTVPIAGAVRHATTSRCIPTWPRPRPPAPTTTPFELVDGGHFIIDERPDLVRAKLIALAEEFPARTV